MSRAIGVRSRGKHYSVGPKNHGPDLLRIGILQADNRAASATPCLSRPIEHLGVRRIYGIGSEDFSVWQEDPALLIVPVSFSGAAQDRVGQRFCIQQSIRIV